MENTDTRSKTGVTWCADYSRAAEEQLCGTAKTVDLWFLVECRGRWERGAEATLPESARRYLATLEFAFPRLRIALIRQPRRNTGPLAVFVAFSREKDSRLYSFEVASHEELGVIDVEQLRLGMPGHLTSKKLLAICTHGTHDRCCAKYGSAIYDTLRRIDPEDVWQISHVGGCRFAPNVVCLPHGIVYGRLREADCAPVATAYREGKLYPQALRGRSCYEKPVQAAEFFLRTALQIDGLDDLALAGASKEGDAQWRIVFQQTGSGRRHEVVLTSEEAAAGTYKNCSATEVAPRERFTLVTCT